MNAAERVQAMDSAGRAAQAAVRRGLARRIAWLIMALLAPFVIGLAVVSYAQARTTAVTERRQAVDAATGIVATRVETVITRTVDLVATFAKLDLLSNALIDAHDSSAVYAAPLLQQEASVLGEGVSIALTDYAGRILHGAMPDPAQVRLMSRRAQDQVRMVSGQVGQGMLIASPIVLDSTGQAEGAVVAWLPLTRLTFGDARVRILRSDERTGLAGTVHRRSLRLPPPCDELDWDLAMSLDLSTDDSALRRLLWTHVVLGLTAMLAAGFAALLLARRIAAPITALSEFAAEVTRSGRMSARVPRLGVDEVAGLEESVQAMLDRLTINQIELEGRVAARTEDLARARDELAAVLANLEDAVWSLSSDATEIRYMSPGAGAVFDQDPAKLLGPAAPWLDLVASQDRPRMDHAVRDLVTGGRVDIEVRIGVRGGAQRWIRHRAVAVRGPDGKVHRIDGTSSDITARVTAAAEQHRLAMVAARTRNAVVITDPHGRITWINEGFARITGYALDEVRGRSPGSFLQGPGTDQAVIAHIRARTSVGEGFRAELLNYHRDGRPYWIDIECEPLRATDGTFAGFMAIESDITLRKSAQDRAADLLRRQDAILQSLPDLLLVVRNDGMVEEAAGDRLLFGVDVHGGRLDERLPAPLVARLLAPVAAARQAGRAHPLTVAWDEAPGGTRSFEGAIAPLDAQRVVLVVREVTARLRQEDDLRRARDAAQQALRAKAAFLAAMSHEIRTPLNGIIGMVDVLAGRLPPGHPALEEAAVIRDSGQVLLAVVNDILDFSKIEAGRLEVVVQPVDAVHAAREAASLFSGVAAAKGLEIRIEGGPGAAVSADPVRLRQILANLLSNGLKFTEQGGVAVRIAVADGVVAIAVSDSGIGIAAEHLGRLFQEFSQVSAGVDRRFGGTGLGLAISRRLALLMGGDITVDSRQGLGSTFTLRLPQAQQAASIAVAQSPAVAPVRAGIRVLVAEDNIVNQRVARGLLAGLGCEVAVVADGELAAAAAMAADRPYDLILMDMQMPVLDGLGAARRIRTDETRQGRPRVPIVALTANAFSEDRDACIAAGMDDLVAKPVNRAALEGVLRMYC